MWGRKWAGVLAALAAMAPPAAASAKCKFQKVAELSVRMEGLRPLVPVKLNGVDAEMILDTGAFYSLLTKQAADKAKLKGVAHPGLRVSGLGGDTFVGVARAKEFTLAGAPIRNVEFMVGSQNFGGGAAGLLGQNVLSFFDVEYDLANGAVRLFQPEDCPETLLSYWVKPGEASVMKIDPVTADQPHITGKAVLDGRTIDVLFDTGAYTSMLTLKAAERAGMRIDAPGVVAGDVSGGVGRGLVESWIAPFQSFALGDEEIRNTRLRVGRYDLPAADMLIGADFFLSHRILVSNSQRRLYFTYNGGPVFRLDQAAAAGRVDGPPAPGGAAPGRVEGAKLDAAALSLRGKASTSRRDFKSAAADFTAAIALEPKVARHYYDRALARIGAGDSAAARQDLDEAARLDPHDARILAARGKLRAAGHDLAGAEADFDAAARLAPDDGGLALQMAAALREEAEYAAAVRRLDSWLAGHPTDLGALNDRCYTRTLWGRDLDKALADCDMAVRKAPRNSFMLHSRGLARLRRGDLSAARADFDAALKLQPRHAASLYGRGLIKLRSGDKAGGETDVKAAFALDPDLVEEVKRHHLTEREIVVAAS